MRFGQVDPVIDEQENYSQYQYAWNNPVLRSDPNGELLIFAWLDAVVDVGFVAYDAAVLIHEKITTGKTSTENWAALGADAVSIAIPMSVGAGMTVRATMKALKKADKVVDVAKTADKVNDVKNVVKKADDTADAMKNRVKLRKGTKETIKDAAPKTKDGKSIDPNTGKPIEEGQEVFGHKKGQEWSKYKKDPANKGKTRKEVIEDQNDPKKYQVEDRKSNASHKYEEKN